MYDQARDARTFALDCPVVAHPPCRAWGNLAHFAKPRIDERDLAWWALHVVRLCGGVLEHPITSKLWSEAGIGTAGVRDRFGGVFITAHQSWWGYRAQKATGFYIVGPVPDMPSVSLAPSRIRYGVSKAMRLRYEATVCPVQGMGGPERMRTPPELASWLLAAARACA